MMNRCACDYDWISVENIDFPHGKFVLSPKFAGFWQHVQFRRYKTVIFLVLITILGICFLGCGRSSLRPADAKQVREITDMAGRKVLLPVVIRKVYSTGQPGVVMLYTLCPDKLLGWDLKLSEGEEDYINAKYLSLPILGLMQGGNNTANKEEIMERSPDMILLMTEIDDSIKETADELQNTIGIPVVIADYSLKKLPEAYEFLGTILNEQKRAGSLSDYCRKTLEEAEETTEQIKPEDMLSVYYAQGLDGLSTAPKGSAHSEVIDLVGGDNVVKLEADSDGRLSINMEQLFIYDPDVIIASYSMDHDNGKGDAFSVVTDDRKEWGLLQAVKKNMVFCTPCFPYNWLDMPPSVNRIIGIKWLGNLLYPDYYKYDIRNETKEFYSLFYQKELTDEALDNLLNGAVKN